MLSKINELAIKVVSIAVTLYLLTVPYRAVASPGHIYNLQKEGGFWWWALAENDVYYDDYSS